MRSITLLSLFVVGCVAEDPADTQAHERIDIQGNLPADIDADQLAEEFIASGAQFGVVGDPASGELATLQRIERTVSSVDFSAAGAATCLECGGANSGCVGPAGSGRTLSIPLQRNVGTGGVDISYISPLNWSPTGAVCNTGNCPQVVDASGGPADLDVLLGGTLDTCASFSVFFDTDLADTTTVGLFTGGDAGEGLDLQGTFVYALETANNTTPDPVVGDAVFTPDTSTAGVTMGFVNTITNWRTMNFGSSAADNALELAMRGIRWTSATQTPAGFDTGTVNAVLTGLVPGDRYKAQILLAEGCCNRGFHIVRDQQLIATNVNPSTLQGGTNVTNQAVVVSHEFTAEGTSTHFVLDAILTAAQLGGAAPPPNAVGSDDNPILSALTLEKL